MKIIDGNDATLGRLASFAAKQALKGDEIVILNCEKVIISGNKKRIKEDYEIKRGRVGSSQKGPKHSKTSDKIVKRTIRGMLPDHREGRGKEAYKRIKCYVGIPKEFQEAKKIVTKRKKDYKFIQIKEISKQ